MQEPIKESSNYHRGGVAAVKEGVALDRSCGVYVYICISFLEYVITKLLLMVNSIGCAWPRLAMIQSNKPIYNFVYTQLE